MNIDYNLIVGIAGIIIGAFIGAVFTWWSISQSRRLAVESGALKKAAPSIYFLKKDLFKNPIESIEFVLLCPKDAELSVFPLSFQVANEGDAPLDSPVFTIQGSIDCVKDVPADVLRKKIVPAVMAESYKRATVNLGNFNQISYMLPCIGNHAAIEVTDCFCFRNTVNVPVTGETKFSDGTKTKYKFSYSFSYLLSLSLLTKDYPTVQSDLRMMCLPADSIDEAKDLLEKDISKGNVSEKQYYAFSQFAIDKRVEHDNKYWYFMKDYSEVGFIMKVFHM